MEKNKEKEFGGIKKEPFGLSLAKLILAVSFIVGGGVLMGSIGYLLAYPEFFANPGQIIIPIQKPAVNKIEISADKKSILNSETGEVIFTIEDVQKYFHDTDLYEGECFDDAVLSDEGPIPAYEGPGRPIQQQIVFSTGCLPDNTKQAWVGIYSIGYKYLNWMGNNEVEVKPSIRFQIAGKGRNFVWSQQDNVITYEADLGIFGIHETRTINLGMSTGHIVNIDEIANWKTYKNTKYGFEFKYPADWKFIDNLVGDFSQPVTSIASQETLKISENNKTKLNGENYSPSADIEIFYYPSAKDIPINKDNNYDIKTLNELINNKNTVLVKQGELMIGDTKAVEVIQNRGNPYYAIFIEKNSHLYEILFNKAQNRSNLTDTDKRIISTLKFFTASWKTYKNDEYGLQFDYPDYWGYPNIIKQIIDTREDKIKKSVSAEDLPKVTKNAVSINFGASLCVDYSCRFDIKIIEYNINTPLQVECEGNVCGLTNIMEEKEKIEQNSNIFLGNLKGKVADSESISWQYYQRLYKVVTSKYKFVFRESIPSNIGFDIPQKFQSMATRGDIFIEEISKANPEYKEIANFIEDSNKVVNTIKFIK